jgi:hypothetical protein
MTKRRIRTSLSHFELRKGKKVLERFKPAGHGLIKNDKEEIFPLLGFTKNKKHLKLTPRFNRTG